MENLKLNLNLKLNKEFEEFVYAKIIDNDSARYILRFPNGYGASIIKRPGSYGYEKDLWELALIESLFNGDTWVCVYEGIVQYDVLGWLTDERVNKILIKIKQGEVDEPVDFY